MHLLLVRTALAAGMHTGIPMHGVEGLTAQQYGTAATGWTAQVPGGLVRVFVGHDEDEAKAWIHARLEAEARWHPTPIEGLGDQAWSSEAGLLLVRDGNLAFSVRARTDPQPWAEALLAAVVDTPEPWPLPPVVEETAPGRWTIRAARGEHVAWEGGQLAPGTDLVFTRPPTAVIGWDRFGRATRQTLDDRGHPIADGR